LRGTLRTLYVVVGYLAAVLTAGSVFAWLAHGVVDFDYPKVLSRSVLLIAGLGLLPLWRLSGLNTKQVGVTPVVWRHAAIAFPVGLAMMAPLMLVFVVVGFRVADARVDYLGADFLSFVPLALLSGVLVGIFEEVLFRGVLFGALRRRLAFGASAAIVGFLYAAVHFLERGELAVETVAWYSGYAQAIAALSGLQHPSAYWDSFVALFLLGVLFCWVRERVGLWWCIGLHASWVFGIRMFKETTVRDIVNPYAELTGTYDNFVGHLVSVWLIFIFVALALQRRAKDY